MSTQMAELISVSSSSYWDLETISLPQSRCQYLLLDPAIHPDPATTQPSPVLHHLKPSHHFSPMVRFPAIGPNHRHATVQFTAHHRTKESLIVVL